MVVQAQRSCTWRPRQGYQEFVGYMRSCLICDIKPDMCNSSPGSLRQENCYMFPPILGSRVRLSIKKLKLNKDVNKQDTTRD